MLEIAIPFGLWLLDKIAGKGFDSLYSKLSTSDDITKKFNEMLNKVATSIQQRYPDVLGNSIEYFFSQKKISDELIKLLFIDATVNIDNIVEELDVETLPRNFIKEFIDELKIEIQKDQDLGDIFSNKEILLAVSDFGKDLSSLKKNTKLTKEEIVNIRKLLEERYRKNFTVDIFRKNYYANALNILSQMNFLGLGLSVTVKKQRKRLQDIFVQPVFKIIDKSTEKLFEKILEVRDNYVTEKEKVLYYKDLFSINRNLVILGEPGGGKSLLVKAIICEILQEGNNCFNDSGIYNYIPFRIELRKYLIFKRAKNGSIIRYLSNVLENEYGILSINYQLIDKLIKENKVIMFFDGLDEIFNVGEKIEIKNDIENLHNSYDKLTSITTSRVIGYEEARLNETKFCELKILKFSEEQINEYVKRWYDCEETNKSIREKEIKDFRDKRNKIDEELITNPLFLSLIVILYRNNLKIPESKLEIYQSYTKTLVDKWDSHKELKIDLDFEIYKKRESIFADLAYWQYQQLSSKSTKITYEQAKQTVENTLISKLKVSDEFTVDQDAEMFLTYAQKRSLYFDNNFTHKTFLEYFTSYWLYTNIEKKHKNIERDKIISRYIENSFWFIVLELFFNLIDKDQPDNEIIDNIISSQMNRNEHSYSFILTVLPSLTNISNEIIKSVFHNAILFLIEPKVKRISKKRRKIMYSVSEKLGDCMMNPDLASLLNETLSNLHSEIRDEQTEKKLFRLLFEFHFWFYKHFDFRKSINMEASNKYVKNDYGFWRLHNAYFESHRTNYIDEMIETNNNFGSKKFNQNTRLEYIELIWGASFHRYFRQLFIDNFEQLDNNMVLLNKGGYSKEQLLDNIYNYIGNHYLHTQKSLEISEKIINRINISDDIIWIKIFLLAIYQLLFFNDRQELYKVISKIKNNVIKETVLKSLKNESGEKTTLEIYNLTI